MKTSQVPAYVLDEISKGQKQRKNKFYLDIPAGCGKGKIAIEILKQKHFKKYRGQIKSVNHLSLIITDRSETLESLQLSLYENGLTFLFLTDVFEAKQMDEAKVFLASPKTVLQLLNEGERSDFRYFHPQSLIGFGPSESEWEQYEALLQNRYRFEAYYFTNLQYGSNKKDENSLVVKLELTDFMLPFKIQDYKIVMEKDILEITVYKELRNYWKQLPDSFCMRKFGRTKAKHLQLLNNLEDFAGYARVDNEEIKASVGEILKYFDSDKEKYHGNNQLIREYKREVKKLHNFILEEYSN